MHLAGGFESVAARADVKMAVWLEPEVSRERVPLSRLPLSHTGMCGAMLCVTLAEQIARAVGDIGGHPLGLEVEACLDAVSMVSTASTSIEIRVGVASDRPPLGGPDGMLV